MFPDLIPNAEHITILTHMINDSKVVSFFREVIHTHIHSSAIDVNRKRDFSSYPVALHEMLQVMLRCNVRCCFLTIHREIHNVFHIMQLQTFHCRHIYFEFLIEKLLYVRNAWPIWENRCIQHDTFFSRHRHDCEMKKETGGAKQRTSGLSNRWIATAIAMLEASVVNGFPELG